MSEGDKRTITDKIFELKDEYMALKSEIDFTDELDPMMYPELLRIRKELSCLSIDLAKETSKYVRESIRLEGLIELNRYKEQTRRISVGEKIGSAEAAARSIDETEKQSYTLNKGLAKTGEMILKQVNEILFSLRQEISIFKKEYESFANS